MCKYIDYEEQKRLSRLRNIRGSINQSMQHNSWQASQLEKRRKEQIRQRKREAKRRTEKKGFQVDTGCAATPYEFTKCGLKLRLAEKTSSSVPVKRGVKGKKETDRDKAATTKSLQLVSQYAIDRIELNRRKPVPAEKNVTKRKDDVNLKMHSSVHDVKMKKDSIIKPKVNRKEVKTKDSNPETFPQDFSRSSSSSNSDSSSEGKENGDNPNQGQPEDNKNSNIETRQQTRGKPVMLSKKTKKKSIDSYFMDFDSLKREHADAIEMLKQLDEENKRLFGKKDAVGLGLDINVNLNAELTKAKEQEETDDVVPDEAEQSFDVTLPEGMLHATHLSISLHDVEGDDLHPECDSGREEGTSPEEDDDSEYSSNPNSSPLCHYEYVDEEHEEIHAQQCGSVNLY